MFALERKSLESVNFTVTHVDSSPNQFARCVMQFLPITRLKSFVRGKIKINTLPEEVKK